MSKDLIRISLKAYDHKLLDKSAEKIIRTAKSTGAIISGPIPMPTKRTVYTVLRSPFIDKKSREQFQTKIHKRIVDIVNSTPKTVESLMKLDLPSGDEATNSSRCFCPSNQFKVRFLCLICLCSIRTSSEDGLDFVSSSIPLLEP